MSTIKIVVKVNEGVKTLCISERELFVITESVGYCPHDTLKDEGIKSKEVDDVYNKLENFKDKIKYGS